MTAPQPAPAAAPDGMAAAFESDCAAREAGFEAIRRDLAKRAPAPAAADARGVVVDDDTTARVSAAVNGLHEVANRAELREDELTENQADAGASALRVLFAELARVTMERDAIIATARPPTAAGAVGAATLAEWRMKAGAARNLASEAGDEDAMCLRGVADALDAACDALASATPAVPAPDRAAVEAAVDVVIDSAYWKGVDGARGNKESAAAWARDVKDDRAALLALVFPDAPAPAPDAAGEAVRDG